MGITADDLELAVSTVVDALRTVAGDGSASAGSLEWDCWHTAEHLGDCLVSYATQVVMQPPDRYPPFASTLDTSATFADALDFVQAGGRILAATVRTAAPTVRAYHPSGQADPAGFAAMGCVEALVHGDDMARGLDLALDPPRDICARVVERMFPHHAAGLAGTDPWPALLWCCGRIALPDRERLLTWTWRGAPAGE